MNITKTKIKNNRKKWVKALRAGKYQQGVGFLNKDNKFCCLGVLCEVMKVPKTIDGYCGEPLIAYGVDREITTCPMETMELVGLRNSLSRYSTDMLIHLNDVKKLTFNEIADIIESEPLGLFNDLTLKD